MSIRALVTAGSAVTMFDDVRSSSLHRIDGGASLEEAGGTEFWHHEMQNIFRGGLGILLAQELAKRGVETRLLLRKDSLAEVSFGEGIQLESFKTFEDLEQALARLCSEYKPNLLFMSAAPPDYAPRKLEGKVRSSEEEITITYRRTPKLLDRLREALSPEAFLVGFKLLVGETPENLDAIAHKQILRAGTDMCVANDLKGIKPAKGIHPMRLVFADEDTIALDGLKTEVVRQLVDEVLTRFQQKQQS